MRLRDARMRVVKRDRGVCGECGFDAEAWERRLLKELKESGFAKFTSAVSLLEARGFDLRRSLWEADHVVPLADGGRDSLENLQTLCQPCHRRKTYRENMRRGA